jgi:hypothetical protein
VLHASFTAFDWSANHSGGALVVQLGETRRIEMAPCATPYAVKKWLIS